jgi:beta-phosphoglucomutase-like phosphatase (HAD superfamily)
VIPDVNNVEAFFFDFDGVLADSVEVKTEAYAKMFESYGGDIVARVVDHHRQHGGMTRAEKLAYYHSSFVEQPLVKEELLRRCDEFSVLVVDKVVAAEEIPGAESFVKQCRIHAPCFVVSATPDDEIMEIVQRRGIKDYFSDIRGSSASKRRHIASLADKYGLHTERCLFFGDAESDYRAAEAHGMPFIGIVPDKTAPLLSVAGSITWYPDFISLMRSYNKQPNG